MSISDVTISVCIPTIYAPDRTKDLERLLHSLTLQSFKNFNVIIIEGKNYEEIKKFAKNFKKIKIISQNSKGLANARNEAWINSIGKICVFIDDDIVANPHWLNEIVKTYEIYNNVGGVGGSSLIHTTLLSSRDITAYLLNPTSLFMRVMRNFYFKIFLENKPFKINKFFRSGAYSIGSMVSEVICKISRPIEVDFLDACNMSYKRRVLEEVGGFDCRYVGLGDYQEPDLCFRVKKKGYKLIFNPNAIIHHFPKKIESGTESSKAYEREKNFTYFVKKNIGISFEFFLYTLFLCCYHLYKSISEKDFNWISGIFGLLEGWLRNKPAEN